MRYQKPKRNEMNSFYEAYHLEWIPFYGELSNTIWATASTLVHTYCFAKWLVQGQALWMYEFRIVSVCALYSAFILNAHFQSIQLIYDLQIRANAIYPTTIIHVWYFGVSVSWAKCIISRKFESWPLLLANSFPEFYVYTNCFLRKMWMNQFYCEW